VRVRDHRGRRGMWALDVCDKLLGLLTSVRIVCYFHNLLQICYGFVDLLQRDERLGTPEICVGVVRAIFNGLVELENRSSLVTAGVDHHQSFTRQVRSAMSRLGVANLGT